MSDAARRRRASKRETVTARLRRKGWWAQRDELRKICRYIRSGRTAAEWDALNGDLQAMLKDLGFGGVSDPNPADFVR